MKQQPELLPLTEPPGLSSHMSTEQVTDLIIDWFKHNFEDPSNETPHDNEDGYQYIWGGPFEADDELNHYFSDIIPEKLLNAIIKQLESDCVYWAPAGWRVQPDLVDDFEEDVSTIQSTSEAYAELTHRIDQLEILLSQIPRTVGIGHNNPPQSEQDFALSNSDLRYIKDAIVVFRAQPVDAPTDEIELAKRTSQLKAIGLSILRYIGKQSDAMITATSQAVGKTVGTCAGVALIAAVTSIDLPSLEAIGNQLLEVASAAETWLQLATSPF